MKQSIRVSLTALTLSLGLVLTVPALVSAQEGSDDNTSTSSNSGSGSGDTSGSGNTAPTTGTTTPPSTGDPGLRQRSRELEAQRDALRERARQIVKTARETHDGKLISAEAVPNKEELEALRKKAEDSLPKQEDQQAELRVEGQKLLAQLKADKPEKSKRSAEDKAQSCDARKDAMAKRFENLVSRNKAIQQRLNGALDKAVAYQQEKQLTSPELASAIAAATTAKAQADASVKALAAAVPTINCDDPDGMAQAVATLKVASKKSHDDLHAYLKSLKDVMKQLLTAKQVTKNDDDQKADDDDSTTTTTTTTTTTEGSN